MLMLAMSSLEMNQAFIPVSLLPRPAWSSKYPVQITQLVRSIAPILWTLNFDLAYYWDNPDKHLTRKCSANGTWEEHDGHCGCHYDILKWDRVAYYFSGFQKFKVLLGNNPGRPRSFHSLFVFNICKGRRRSGSIHCVVHSYHLYRCYVKYSSSSKSADPWTK